MLAAPTLVCVRVCVSMSACVCVCVNESMCVCAFVCGGVCYVMAGRVDSAYVRSSSVFVRERISV